MSGGKQESCAFTHMWDIKQKAMNKENKIKTYGPRQQHGGYERDRGPNTW